MSCCHLMHATVHESNPCKVFESFQKEQRSVVVAPIKPWQRTKCRSLLSARPPISGCQKPVDYL